MSDLRAKMIKVGAWELYTGDCEPVAPADFCPGCGSDAERILDAFLDCLAENADEWWFRAFEPDTRGNRVTDGLLAVLRESVDE